MIRVLDFNFLSADYRKNICFSPVIAESIYPLFNQVATQNVHCLITSQKRLSVISDGLYWLANLKVNPMETLFHYSFKSQSKFFVSARITFFYLPELLFQAVFQVLQDPDDDSQCTRKPR